MTDNKYLTPAIACLVLAILFPVYWGNLIFNIAVDGGEPAYEDLIGLNMFDLVFLITGLLTTYVYLNLKRFLNERFASRDLDAPLLLLAITTIFYTFGSLTFDVFMQVFGERLHLPWHSGVVKTQTVAAVISTILFGVLDIALGLLLLTKASGFSSHLKTFAIIILVQGVFELTLLFSPVVVATFPASLIVLALLFTQEPEMLEVV